MMARGLRASSGLAPSGLAYHDRRALLVDEDRRPRPSRPQRLAGRTLLPAAQDRPGLLPEAMATPDSCRLTLCSRPARHGEGADGRARRVDLTEVAGCGRLNGRQRSYRA